jgi:DnaJ like chaperone protein
MSKNASQEQIVAAYKQKIRQYHPDKVAQMGAEIRELAEFKSKQINAAYDYAMKLGR